MDLPGLDPIFPASGDFVNFSPVILSNWQRAKSPRRQESQTKPWPPGHKPGPQHPMEKPKGY